MRPAFTVMSRSSWGRHWLASMALSRALPKMVLMSRGSMKAPSSRAIAALKSIWLSRAFFRFIPYNDIQYFVPRVVIILVRMNLALQSLD